MWIVFVLLLVFGFTILDCISDLLEFEKFLENKSEFDLSNSESEDCKNGKHS